MSFLLANSGNASFKRLIKSEADALKTGGIWQVTWLTLLRPAKSEKLARRLAVNVLIKFDVAIGDRARAVHDRKPNNRRGKIGRRFERVTDVIRGPREHGLLRWRLD